jgi:hypothetical protein
MVIGNGNLKIKESVKYLLTVIGNGNLKIKRSVTQLFMLIRNRILKLRCQLQIFFGNYEEKYEYYVAVTHPCKRVCR